MWQWWWWYCYAGDFMMMTGFRWCWLFLCTCIKSVTNTSNLSPTHFVSNIYYQNRYNSLIQVEHTQTDRRRYDRQRRTISLNDEYIELLGQKLAWKYLAKPFYHTENIMIFKYSIKWVTETTLTQIVNVKSTLTPWVWVISSSSREKW